MGNNLVREIFEGPGNWVCPAGVTKVWVSLYETLQTMDLGADFTIFRPTNSPGAIRGYGINSSGQLGDGTTSNRSINSGTSSLPSSFYRLVKAGASHSIVMPTVNDANGINLYYVWGANANGQLGDLSIIPKSSANVITIMNSLPVKFKSLALGNLYTIAIDCFGDIYSWGDNAAGQLSTNNTTPRSSPAIAAVGGLKFKKIVSGNNHVMGITTAGELYSWGQNTNGKLGDGTLNSRSSPVLVAGGHRFVQIAASQEASYGVKADGTAYAWGGNASGQLGDGTIVSKSTPVLISGNVNWRSISGSFGDWTTGISKTGVGYSWGANASGQLGDGTIVPKSSPIVITGGLLWSETHGGLSHAGGIDSKGRMFMWGLGTSGQLGDGTAVSKSSPVQIVFDSVSSNQFFWPVGMNNFTRNRIPINVVPGLTYFVETQGLSVSFGGQVLNCGMMNELQIEVEYFA